MCKTTSMRLLKIKRKYAKTNRMERMTITKRMGRDIGYILRNSSWDAIEIAR